jgi:hypothetical protein
VAISAKTKAQMPIQMSRPITFIRVKAASVCSPVPSIAPCDASAMPP